MTKLKQLRQCKKITQTKMAMLLGIHPVTYSRYENKLLDIDKADIKILLNICNILKCHLEDILEDEEVVNSAVQYEMYIR